MTKLSPRNLDHVVFPVPNLEIARERLTSLGFTVAPDARHKFGSENACVFFENGTFFEPLAIGHRETVEADIMKGNNFLRRDAAYRFRNGDDGFSMVVMGDKDPVAQRKAIKKAGYQTGKTVIVRRPGVKVHLAFIIDERAPDCSFFLCERPDGPPSFPAEMTDHANGAKAIGQVTLHEHLPEDFQYYQQFASGEREVRSHSFGMDIELPNTTLSTYTDAGMKAHYGVEGLPQRRGLKARAVDVIVSDLGKVADLLKKNGVEARTVGKRLIVDPAEGQGAIIAFVEG
ncbi:MAG: VOC family protein [Pseudomonadota bacterium]